MYSRIKSYVNKNNYYFEHVRKKYYFKKLFFEIKKEKVYSLILMDGILKNLY